MTAAALWTSVKASYPSSDLILLTNPQEGGSATAIDDTFGQSAAQEVIDLWPIYAQVAYDSSNSTHVAVARRGVLAVLYQRGGKASESMRTEWGEVFGDDGMIGKVKRTSPRAHAAPSSNSGVTTSSEAENGVNVRGWADRDSIPYGILPSRSLAQDG